MATESISQSVGSGGVNDPIDKQTISKLLAGVSTLEGGTFPAIPISPLRKSDSDLNDAIANFQRIQFKGAVTDGRVDPGGTTLARLNLKAFIPPKPKPGVAISAAVGKPPARNSPSDSDKITDLLSRVLAAEGGPDEPIFPAPFPGQASPSLVKAIERFQRFHLSGFFDGRVDPDGKTLERLNKITNNGTGPKRTLRKVEIISGAVGRPPARNNPVDQARIIAMILTVPVSEGGPQNRIIPVGVLPGQVSRELVDAIVAFQRKQFNGFSDGRIDPDGKTLDRLIQKQVIRPF